MMVKKYLLSTFSLSKNCTHASFTEPCDIGFFPTFYNKTEVIHTNVAKIYFFQINDILCPLCKLFTIEATNINFTHKLISLFVVSLSH